MGLIRDNYGPPELGPELFEVPWSGGRSCGALSSANKETPGRNQQTNFGQIAHLLQSVLWFEIEVRTETLEAKKQRPTVERAGLFSVVLSSAQRGTPGFEGV